MRGLLYFLNHPYNWNAVKPRLGDYREAKEVLCGPDQLSNETITNHLHLVDPEAYYNIAKSTAGVQLDAETAFELLPPLLSMLYLRRTSASIIENVNGETVRVGESIPHGEWKSIELQRNALESQLYALVHCMCAGNLGADVDYRGDSYHSNNLSTKYPLPILSVNLD